MANKIITDDILKKATEGVMQTIADNIFEFESYSDESIAELFDLTSEEAEKVSQLINDEVISKYKIWSSYGTNEVIKSAISEANDYTDNRLSNLASISLKYCTALPTMGESNCIYILKSTNSNPDTLNLYDVDNASWVSIGSFDVSLNDYYTKTEIDTALVLKADKIEILAQDDVLTDISLATTTNVLSATTTIEELDKKVDKTSIVTSISSTSTDDTVPSAKAVYDNVIKNNNIKTYTDITQLGLTTPTTVENIFKNMPDNSLLCQMVDNYSITNVPYGNGILIIHKRRDSKFSIEFKISAGGTVAQNYLYIGQLKGGDVTGLTWQRVCTTSVEDVPVTNITETLVTSNATGETLSYFVKDGKCYIELDAIKIVSISSGGWLSSFNFPKPYLNRRSGYKTIQSWQNNKVLQLSIMSNGKLAYWCETDSVGSIFYGQFSYPVAES